MANKDVLFVRVPKGLKTQLKEAAQQNGHTLTAEIIQRLRASFEYGRGLL